MFAEKRFREIIDLVNERKTITVAELSELLHASESTVRRDLTVLHKKGALIKVHGGASAADEGYSTRDAKVSERQDLNREAKRRIAVYAAGLIKKEDFVYIDAGTSTGALVEAIWEREAVYVTNGISHAQKLAGKGCRVFVLGGEVKEYTEAVVGSGAEQSVTRYHFTKGFFGTNGIHKEKGYTTPDVREALMKEAAMKQCRECFVLADSSKFNQICAAGFGKFEDATVLTCNLQDASYQKCKNIKNIREVETE